jgi:GNAT superfamily N-acetyltransferase
MALRIRRMQLRDLEAALKLTQAQRWPHRLEDWEFHFRLGRGCVACDDNDRPIGTALWWAYGNEFGTVGLVVVEPSQQGKGIGRQLMNTVMADAGARALQLLATQAGLKLYQQCGFRECGSIGQHQGVPAAIGAVALPPNTLVRPVSREDLASLCELDAAAFGSPRRWLIHAVFEVGRGIVAETGGRLAGFAMMRSSGRGTVIGPVIANDQALAIALIAQMLRETAGFVRLDIPAQAAELDRWLEGVGLACIDRVVTMVRGTAPEQRGDARVFCLVSHALS